jgi:hypothetical protein
MKAALLIFIHKSGDPLEFHNYRGISLLSCFFKILTGILNGRLQQLLAATAGLDTNQGANRKGIHAAHKAAVLFNLLSHARQHDEPIHIVYTDIKGAFPSVPYRAFADALQCIGLDGSWISFLKRKPILPSHARRPTGLSAPYAKTMGVHEGDCLSPTMFTLVLNMFFIWLRSENLGYITVNHHWSPIHQQTQIPANGYADDLALIAPSNAQVARILGMLETFLLYYHMALAPLKCGYRFHDSNPLYRPPPLCTSWGLIPLLSHTTPYKYLGFHVITALNFTYQYYDVIDRLHKATQQLLARQQKNIPLSEAITYTNSDVGSVLRYRMYLITFPQKYLTNFQTILARTV